MATTVKPAPVKWAQRSDLVYVNFQVQDIDKPEISVEKDKVTYRAVSKDKQKYETVLHLFGEVKPEDSKWVNRERGAEFVLIKAQPGFWKRLLKEDTKYHWLSVDFNRWKDEDDSEDEGGAGGTNFEEMMRQMGGLGGGPGGASPFNELDDLDVEDEKDSDDENIPDLEEEKPSDEKKE